MDPEPKPSFIDTARKQLENCAIPTAVAITASVVISKLGIPIIFTGGAAAGAYFYFRGYRIRLVKQTTQEDTDEDSSPCC